MQKPPQTSLHQFNQWEFHFCQSGLSSSAEIEQIAQQCKLFRPPTIIFGHNYCQIKHKTNNFELLYNAKQALKLINYESRKQNLYTPLQNPRPNGISYNPPKLQVKHAEKWKDIDLPKDVQFSSIQQTSDSFFITPFKGKLSGIFKAERCNHNVIPLQKLGVNNQMKFYKQGSFYQDQLDDNGLIQYQYKLRTMADQNWFTLIRCYIRVDDVIVLILDTRLYWQQGWNKIARQFMVKGCKYNQLKIKGFDIMGGWTTNHHQSHLVYQYLDQMFVQNQYIIFNS